MKYRLLLLLTAVVILLSPQNIYAAYGFGCSTDPNDQSLGPFAALVCGAGGPTGKDTIAAQFNKTLGNIIGFLTIVAALWFFIQFILAGIAWISAGGDKHAVETARNKIMYGVIGMGIVVAAWVIIGLVGAIMGLDILNPGKILLQIMLARP